MQTETKASSNTYGSVRVNFQKVYVYLVQVLISPILLTIRLLIVRDKLHRDIDALNFKSSRKKTNYILYSNHQSMLDPFIITASLPLRTIKQLIPFRYFVANAYFKGPLKVFLNLLGGFPAQYVASRPYGIDCAKSMMATNQTVVIFPQGKRTREHIVKAGISILAAELNTCLIPFHIDWKTRWHCEVYIGAPIKGGVTLPPERLMKYVYELPN